MTDPELLSLVISEQERSIGFELDADLTEQREQSLQYYKGEMLDVPAMTNRSKAVSMDVRDGIQAVIPDLLDIFTGGDDVAVFLPIGEEDEEQAKLETEYVNHVVFNLNDGWSVFNSVILDALQIKTGVFKWWAEEGEQPPDQVFENKTAAEIEMASQDGEIIKVEPVDDYTEDGEPLYEFTLRPPKDEGKICIASLAPEDLTVARDTVRLADATYCCARMRPRAQDLIAQGLDEDLVKSLPEYDTNGDGIVQMARDTVDETVSNQGASNWRMRQVLVFEHYIRIKDKGENKLYCVLTGGENASAVLLRVEEVSRIQIAAVTPYTVSHRFYGNSMSDMLIDIQRIKSQLQRMTLDSGYFALNQRHEVSDQGANANTVTDLLNNIPGAPVRVARSGTVTPISSPGLNIDTLGQLEYFSTVAEERTGAIRAAQGLNPDTLHDTKGGMLAMLSRSQRRTRMIARTFAETGIKDFFMGVHALVRETISKPQRVRLNSKWVDLNPSEWSARNDMSIEIGLGAGGREHDLMVMQQIIELQSQAVQAQGGINGPLVTAENLYNSATRFAEKAGVKTPSLFFSDPKEAEPKKPQPDPAMMEMQAKTQLEEQKIQLKAQSDQARLQQDGQKALGDYELKRQQAEFDAAMAQQKSDREFELRQYQIDQELMLKREQLAAELDLKREQMAAELELKREQMALSAMVGANVPDGGSDLPDGGSDIGDVSLGGDPG